MFTILMIPEFCINVLLTTTTTRVDPDAAAALHTNVWYIMMGRIYHHIVHLD